MLILLAGYVWQPQQDQILDIFGLVTVTFLLFSIQTNSDKAATKLKEVSTFKLNAGRP